MSSSSPPLVFSVLTKCLAWVNSETSVRVLNDCNYSLQRKINTATTLITDIVSRHFKEEKIDLIFLIVQSDVIKISLLSVQLASICCFWRKYVCVCLCVRVCVCSYEFHSVIFIWGLVDCSVEMNKSIIGQVLASEHICII